MLLLKALLIIALVAGFTVFSVWFVNHVEPLSDADRYNRRENRRVERMMLRHARHAARSEKLLGVRGYGHSMLEYELAYRKFRRRERIARLIHKRR